FRSASALSASTLPCYGRQGPPDAEARMSAPTISLTPHDRARLDALFEEYRSLYGLAHFRLSALDRRVPLGGLTLAACPSRIGALPEASRTLALIAVPLASMWLLRVTINHARSFEDALRHIEGLETRINGLLGDNLVTFQSRHPSGDRVVGGRTGRESVGAVL